MRCVPVACVSWILLAPAPAWSDDVSPPHDPRAAHAATDRDQNGEIDREEFEQRMIQIFYLNDADKDGFVTLGQLAVYDEALLFESADLDSDTQLSLSEFLAARFEHFREADTDGSGTLSVGEIVEDFNE